MAGDLLAALPARRGHFLLESGYHTDLRLTLDAWRKTMTTRRAACSCGQLALAAEGEPIRISMCHCLACQRRTGSVFGAQARFPRDKVTIEGRSTEYVRTGDSGGRITFHFCPECGATVYYRVDQALDVIAVPVGAFADPAFPAPRVSVYEARRHAWVGMPPDVEHLD